MKYTIICFILFFNLSAFAQSLQKVVLHEVSGIVQDTTASGIPNATVMLVSAQDTLKMMANEDGIFLFNNVKAAVFTVTVSSVGFAKAHRKYFFNAENERLVLEPIILKDEKFVLNEIKVTGKVGVIYKTDTVEYRASDYKVREYANVGELLKKMEGIEVDKMGKVTHNGDAVVGAKFNGKRYFNGNISEAIKELPADIVEKIQIIDDYGEQAELTGIKSGAPVKMLNVVSKADKSVGNLAELTAETGNDKRYGFVAGLRQINGTKQLGLKGILNQKQVGVADPTQENAIAATAGLLKNANLDFSYANKFGKKTSLELGYTYQNAQNNTQNSSNSTELYNAGYVNTIINNQQNTRLNTHSIQAKLKYSLNGYNTLIFNLGTNFNNQNSASEALNELSGLIKTSQQYNRQDATRFSNYNLLALYLHAFKKEKRIFSVEAKYSSGLNKLDNGTLSNLLYYNAQTGSLLLDSLTNLSILNRNKKYAINGKATYSEPLSAASKLDFSLLFNSNTYDNRRTTGNIDPLGFSTEIDSLNSLVNYTFTETRLAASYALDYKKIKLNVGISAIPTSTHGSTQILGQNIQRNNFNLAPIFRISYLGSKRMMVSLNYNAQSIEPTFSQLQPVVDLSNLQNLVIGNPNLKTAFRHSLSGGINKYFIRSEINASVNLTASIIRNRVVQNVLIIPDTLNSLKRETRYLNINGTRSFGSNFNIGKNFPGGIFGVQYSGLIRLDQSPLINNNQPYRANTLNLNQKLSIQANVLSWLEFNPTFQYIKDKMEFSVPQTNNFNTSNTVLGLIGNVYFSKLSILNIDATKNYISGIENNLSNNPFVLNTSFSQRMFKRKNGVLSFKVYDIFGQNNFVNRKTINNTIVDTRTNTLSRYFMLNFTWAPQKWTGNKNAQGLRNGDGSFLPIN